MTLPERSSSPAVDESAAEAADYIFTFSSEAYADASRRGMMRPPDRLLSTLIARPEVRQLLVANPYRSWTTAWARTVLDFPHRFRSTRTRHVVSPLRLARADPVDVPGIERVYAGVGPRRANPRRVARHRETARDHRQPARRRFRRTRLDVVEGLYAAGRLGVRARLPPPLAGV